MTNTFFDQNGSPIAYTEDGVHIYLFSGEPVAYIDVESIYSYSGKHLGRFESGWIRDNTGKCVFYTENASNGPNKPMRQMQPMKSIKQIKPMKSIKEMRPMRPMDVSSWSGLANISFFN